MINIYFETHGCTMNANDSEIMQGILKAAGYDIVNEERLADIIVLNTCIVKTDKKMVARLKDLETNAKNNRQKFIVTGCMPQVELNLIEEIAPSATAIIGPHFIYKIANAVQQIQNGRRVIEVGIKPRIKLGYPKLPTNSVIWITPIAEGCLGACTYCIVKFARGRLLSYPKELIVKNIEKAVKNGFKEIEITAQDVGAYGFELGYGLPELLHEINRIDGQFFVRVGMINPRNVFPTLDELANAFSLEKIYKFLHLPVQSGDNQILQLMKRDYFVEDCIKIIEKFRKKIPELTLSTDIIIGFPTETEEQFENSCKLIEKIQPDIINISRFSPRPGTEAARMKGRVLERTVKERSRELTELRMKIGLERNQRFIGKETSALITELGKSGTVIGRTPNYKPVVINGNSDMLGKFVNIKIIGARPTYLLGELASS